MRNVEKYHCLNGKDPKKLSPVEILTEFGLSGCSPFIFAPGLMASKLVVELDCVVFRENYPEIFKNCGFTTCEKKSYFDHVPHSEY